MAIKSGTNKKAKKSQNVIQLRQELSFRVRESYKKARAAIKYSVIKKGCKKILFTSSAKSEGKSLTTVNIALALAQQIDTRVVVVDCDLRRPTVHKLLNLGFEKGIANYLNYECDIDDIILPTSFDNLSAICFGTIPPNPSELLSSEGMLKLVEELEKRYDYILFDTPPINVVVDAVPLIRISDGVVLIIKDKSTTYPLLGKALDEIKRVGGKVLGIIVNQVDHTESKKDYYYYRYY